MKEPLPLNIGQSNNNQNDLRPDLDAILAEIQNECLENSPSVSWGSRRLPYFKIEIKKMQNKKGGEAKKMIELQR